MSLNNTFLCAQPCRIQLHLLTTPRYVIFHPLAYLVKLHIELSMADLIAKIVKAAGPDLACACVCHHNNVHPFAHHLSANSHNSAPAELGGVVTAPDRMRRSWPNWSAPLRIIRRGGDDDEARRASASRDSMGLRMFPRTEQVRGQAHSYASQPQRKDSGLGVSSLASSMGHSSTSKSTTDHQD